MVLWLIVGVVVLVIITGVVSLGRVAAYGDRQAERDAQEAARQQRSRR